MFLPNPLASRFGRLTTFFFLYVTEGIPLGFTAVAVVTQMRRAGVGPDTVGLFLSSLYLPWSFKFLAGPVVDMIYSDRLGRRRGWIAAMQGLMALMLVVLMPVPFDTHLRLYTLLVAVLNVFAATQDVAIDALACGVLEEDERGVANGLMFAGASVGQAVGGSGVLFLSTVLGFPPTYLFAAGSVLFVTVFFVLPIREKPTPRAAAEQEDVWARIAAEIRDYCVTAVRAFFGSRVSVAALVFALLPAGAYSLSLALQSNLAPELGLSDEKISLLNLFSTLIFAVFCVAGGFLSDRFGRRRVMAVSIIATALPTLWLASAMSAHGWVMPIDMKAADRPVAPAALLVCFWAATLSFNAFQGLMYGVRTALFMDVCDPRVAATQFTAYMALLNLVISYSGAWQGLAIRNFGYPATLVLDAAFGLVCLAVLPLTRRGRWWRWW